MQTYIYLVCLFVAVGGFLFGYDTGVISGVIEMDKFIHYMDPILEKGKLVMSTEKKSVVVSSLIFGCLLGSLFAGQLADRMGRKYGIMLGTLIFCVGASFQTFAHSATIMIIGRVIAGLAIGQLSMLVPLYQSEVAPKHIRGALITTYQLAITIGIFISFVINYLCKDFSSDLSFQVPLGLQVVFGAILCLGMFVMPFSPRWLLRHNRSQEAERWLAKLRSKSSCDNEVQQELAVIRDSIEEERREGSCTYGDLLQGTLFRRVAIGVIMQAFQQLTGINFIFYYGVGFFRSAGVENEYMFQAVTGLVNVLSTLPAIYLIERLGRRKLLIGGAVVMGICQLLIAILGVIFAKSVDDLKSHPSVSYTIVVLTCIFISAFACTWGPVAWVIVGEIYPLKARAKGMSIATASNWLLNWLIGLVTPFLADSLGMGVKISFIWGVCAVLMTIWVYFAVPETKGKSLEEIDDMFENRTTKA